MSGEIVMEAKNMTIQMNVNWGRGCRGSLNLVPNTFLAQPVCGYW